MASKPRPPRPAREPKPAATPAKDKEAKVVYQDGLRALFRGQVDEAVRKFNRALKLNRRFSLAYKGLGLAYEKMGRKAMAKASFNRYLILRPDAPDKAMIRKRIERLK